MYPRAKLGVLLALLSLCAAVAHAVEPTLTADTHVNAALPAVNSGTVSNIAVGAGYTGLLQFDLATLPTGTTAAQISRATLRLYVNRVDTPGSITVSPVSSAWSEYAVTYSSLPAAGSSIGTVAVSQVGSYVTLDITTTVQSWLTSPTTNNGLALTATIAAVQFDSKENDLTAHPAQLDITLTSQGATGASGPAGATGPAGPQGPSGANGLPGAQGPAGANGAPGSNGVAGATGPAGPSGSIGPAGPAGPTGATGAQGIKGLPGVGIEGPYSSATNYGLNDVVTWQGSSYYSLVASNHGNTPGLSPTYWAILAAAGIGTTGPAGPAGATGPAGLTGPQGLTGATGLQGATGTQGPRGLPGLVYQGAYASATNYALGDVVLWQGASWSSLVDGNHGNTPSFSPSYWGVLTQQGPTGAQGATGIAGPTGASGALGPVGPPGERGDKGLQGIAGQAGAQGIPGMTGAQGLGGPAGPQGVAGPVGLAFQGTYNSTQNYALADGVIYNGAGYVSLLAGNHGNTPDQSPAAWSLFATGTPGATGSTGAPGAVGPTGPQGQQGFTGATGAQGPIGPQGPQTVVYTGNYSSATNYNLNDAAAFAGSTYVSMVAGNHGNTPGLSPAYWTVLVAKGDPGASGIAGPAGAAGATGAPGSTGPAGATGAQGPPIAFAGLWSVSQSYNTGDAVNYGGSGYIALNVNTGNRPDTSPGSWGLLAAQGLQGPAGTTGPAGPAGSQGAQGLQGIAGQAGAQGIPGSAGAQGPGGPAGQQGVAGPVGLAFQGTYSSAQNYALADGVIFNGAGYVSLLANNHGNAPDQSPSAWSLFATGTPGAMGSAGAPGAVGPAGPQGQQGFSGPAGAQGPIGPQGPAAVVYTGNYSSATNYNLNDAAAYQGSTYISMVAGNHGNTPSQSPAYWTVLVAKGDPGAQGVSGAPGSAGATGAIGPAGVAGAQGPPVTFVGGWASSRSYNLGDAVSYSGSSYIALAANTARQPDVSPLFWGLLAANGTAGPAGTTGAQGLQGPTGFAGPAGPTGATGSAGPQGPAGLTGATGTAGPQGVAGPQGQTGIAGLAYRGAYNSATNYGLNDGVVYGGSTYISLAASNAGNSPDVSPMQWSLLAAQGSPGVAGAAGSNGTNGAAGATGATGPQGVQGPAGAAGANGSAGLTYQGAWLSSANYALNDAVTYNGSSYLSLVAGNHGNAPAAGSVSWALLAQMGSAGAAGMAGPAGATGAQGAQGPAGAQGATGASGAAGINFRGAWVTGSGYATNDAVTYQGATYLAQVANASVAPGSNASVWAMLAAAGSAGPTGAAGSAATVAIGTVTTGAAGTSASVTNSGSAGAAVLNFTIPQGAAGAGGSGGGGGGSGTSGIPYAAMYHSVSYAATYYSVNNTNQSASETASVLTWVPQGCSATRLDVFSQQGATITVTLRVGTPGAMADTALSCSVATGKSCTVSGAVGVAAGQFLDIGITHPDSNAVGVWTALSCN